MEIKTIYGQSFESNMHIIISGNEFLLIDASCSIDKVEEVIGEFEFASKNQLNLKNSKEIALNKENSSQNIMHSTLHSMVCLGVVITHGHFDHIYKLDEYVQNNALIYLTKECMQNLKNPYTNGSIICLKKPLYEEFSNFNFVILEKNSQIKVGDEILKVKQTAGHTNCSISLYDENNLFSGDLLFAGGYIGRYDLPTSNKQELKQSIEWVNTLNNKKVHSGHGENFYLNDYEFKI
ncbi:MAG: MBL fold metallo-hydrolase [Clostridia bacterium]|nr:MBL fold metallo-hydrolase [Clostridia bacterium]